MSFLDKVDSCTKKFGALDLNNDEFGNALIEDVMMMKKGKIQS